MLLPVIFQRACRNIVFIEENDRLMPFLKKLSNRLYVGKNYVGTDACRVTSDMVDSVCFLIYHAYAIIQLLLCWFVQSFVGNCLSPNLQILLSGELNCS